MTTSLPDGIARLDWPMTAGAPAVARFVGLLEDMAADELTMTAGPGLATAAALTGDGDDLVATWAADDVATVLATDWRLARTGLAPFLGGRIRTAMPADTPGEQTVTVTLADETTVDVSVEVGVGSTAAAIAIPANSLAVLDPTLAEAALTEWGLTLGATPEVAAIIAGQLATFVTRDPADVQAALETIADLLGLTMMSLATQVAALTAATVNYATVAALAAHTGGDDPHGDRAYADLVATGAVAATPVLFDSGAESGGKWAMVCSPGSYSTPDIGPLATLAPAGYVDVVRAVALAGDPSRTGELVSFLEWLTQRRHDPAVLDIDLDNDEGAFAIRRDELGLFNEHCRTSTPTEVPGGEHDPGRLYTFRSSSAETWVDPRLKLTLGQPVTIRFEHRFDIAGASRKTFWLRTAEPWADLTDTEGRYWWKVAELNYPGTDSVADAGEPWWIGLNTGLMGVEHIDRRPLVVAGDLVTEGDPSSIFLHFDTADLQPDGTVVSSVVDGMVWPPTGSPYVVDTTVAGRTAAIAASAAAAASAAVAAAGALDTAARHVVLPTDNPDRSAAGFSWLFDVSCVADGYMIGSPALGAHLEWDVPLRPGTWTLTALYTAGTAAGIARFSLAGEVLGADVDLYAAATTRNLTITRSGIVVGSAGVKVLRIESVGKHASSTGYRLTLQRLYLRRTA